VCTLTEKLSKSLEYINEIAKRRTIFSRRLAKDDGTFIICERAIQGRLEDRLKIVWEQYEKLILTTEKKQTNERTSEKVFL
jgi:hypothetical protein